MDKVGHGAAQPVGGRNEVGVEYGYQFPLGTTQAVVKGASLIPMPVGPTHVVDVHSQAPEVLDGGVYDAGSLIVRIIEHLDF